MKTHPLARTLRIDKLTLAALSATVDQYLWGRADQLPVHKMLTAHAAELQARACQITERLIAGPGWNITVEHQQVLIDIRSVMPADDQLLANAVQSLTQSRQA